MLTPWILLLVMTISSNAETTTPSNTNITTLYPVNKTIIRNHIQTRDNDTDIKPNDNETKPCDTEIRPSDTEIQISDTGLKSSTNQMRLNVTRAKSIESETGANDTETNSKTQNKSRPTPQTWNIESSFVESNLTDSNKTADVKAVKENKDKDLLKDFKPSQHLGSFFDYDGAEVIKTPAFGPVHKKPASGFISSTKDEYHSHETFNKIPKQIYYTHQEFPYKFEDTIYTRTKGEWPESLESKPTVEVPVKVPAGGLYKSPEAFKEKPHSEEEFGLAVHEDGKEHVIRKRVNPWKNLLRLVTAFIPVGLIISALTPSIITIHNVNDNQQTSLPYRRSDSGAGVAELAPINERCRRRLLCELQSDTNYLPPSSVPRRRMKHCYKIHCEDTEALWRMLRWLFTYNQGDDDQRGRRATLDDFITFT